MSYPRFTPPLSISGSEPVYSEASPMLSAQDKDKPSPLTHFLNRSISSNKAPLDSPLNDLIHSYRHLYRSISYESSHNTGSSGSDTSHRTLTEATSISSSEPHLTPTKTNSTNSDSVGATIAYSEEANPLLGESLLSVSYSRQPSGHVIASKQVKPNTPNTTPAALSDSKRHSYYLESTLENSFFRGLNCSLGETQTEEVLATTKRNPHKALLTVSLKTGEVLTVNKYACRLWGVSGKELAGRSIREILTQNITSADNRKFMFWDEVLNSKGEVLKISGKVMKVTTAIGEEIFVSVWFKKLHKNDKNREERAIIVIEPVELTVAVFNVDSLGVIKDMDPWFPVLFGYSSQDEIISRNMTELISSIHTPFDFTPNCTSLCTTGRTKNGDVFPLCLDLMVSREFLEQGSEILKSLGFTFPIAVTIFTSISGLVSLHPNGSIYGCNQYFSRFLFGYSSEELKGQSITKVVPHFFNYLETLEEEYLQEQLSYSCLLEQTHGTDGINRALFESSSNNNNNSSSNSNILNRTSTLKPESKADNKHPLDQSLPQLLSTGKNLSNLSLHGDTSPLSISPPTKTAQNVSGATPMFHTPDLSATDTPEAITYRCSTPSINASFSNSTSNSFMMQTDIVEGVFVTTALHKDGSAFTIQIQLRKIPLPASNSTNVKSMICLWVSRAQDEVRGKTAHNPSHTMRNSHNHQMSITKKQFDVESSDMHPEDDDGTAMEVTPSTEVLIPDDEIEANIPQVLPNSGEFSNHYNVMNEIGSGAFGLVNLCKKIPNENSRNDSTIEIGEMVVVKFLFKAKVFPESWLNDNLMGRIPKEILILSKLQHPGVVSLLEVYQNPEYFQMVMRKHGDGLDLFDFIELHPLLDEPIVSYIFRQIVESIAYLHNCGIAHRDIKDENIIIDSNLRTQLIDFGSADFMEPGKLFSTFCGTMEYCSPEILMGNKYYGPELEVWTIGIILYTLTFFENPFMDIEEAIEGKIIIPSRISADLTRLLFSVLDPNPITRAPMKKLISNKWIFQKVDIRKYNFYHLTRGQIKTSEFSTSFEDIAMNELPSNNTFSGKTQNKDKEPKKAIAKSDSL